MPQRYARAPGVEGGQARARKARVLSTILTGTQHCQPRQHRQWCRKNPGSVQLQADGHEETPPTNTSRNGLRWLSRVVTEVALAQHHPRREGT